jgi:putative radical SAM enzyme (TIGR03279 family)
LLTVSVVRPDSTAENAGLMPGDRLLSINGHELRDSIDFQYFSSNRRLVMMVESPSRDVRRVTITKAPDDTLGIVLRPFPVRRCRNRCIFCFLDQMPAGCRKTLYVKDDDYRASFLFGNYITLSNMRQEDWDRIFAQRLSPLYVSVHATDLRLRSFLLGNEAAPDILAQIGRLAAGGIRIHAQVVLCPGINDGPYLERTVMDLAMFYPAVESIAVVPVGLTAFRRGLFPLKTYGRADAKRVIAAVDALGRKLRRRLGTRLVFVSDEFYVRAGLSVPAPSYYEDFPQLENGVGMVAHFLREAAGIRLPRRFTAQTVTVISGVSFSPILGELLKRVNQVEGADIRLLVARNRFFGETVTVSGLLTGFDIMRTIHGKKLGSMLIIPSNTLKDDEWTFLDGRTIDDLRSLAGVPVRVASTFGELIGLLHESREKKEIEG